MAKKDKLIARLQFKLKDFDYKEAETLLGMCGHKVIDGSGSRVSHGPNQRVRILDMHKPHGSGQNSLKPYQSKGLIEFLKGDGE